MATDEAYIDFLNSKLVEWYAAAPPKSDRPAGRGTTPGRPAGCARTLRSALSPALAGARGHGQSAPGRHRRGPDTGPWLIQAVITGRVPSAGALCGWRRFPMQICPEDSRYFEAGPTYVTISYFQTHISGLVGHVPAPLWCGQSWSVITIMMVAGRAKMIYLDQGPAAPRTLDRSESRSGRRASTCDQDQA